MTALIVRRQCSLFIANLSFRHSSEHFDKFHFILLETVQNISIACTVPEIHFLPL
jgi:hypothetical protein